MNINNLGSTSLIYTPDLITEIAQCANNDNVFFESLKFNNSAGRFQILYPLIDTFSPKVPNDRVIGIFYKDTNPKYSRFLGATAKYKQDFIIQRNHEFISFTSEAHINGSSIYVKPIKSFFDVYGEEGKYYYNGRQWNHHYASINDLPQEIIDNNVNF